MSEVILRQEPEGRNDESLYEEENEDEDDDEELDPRVEVYVFFFFSLQYFKGKFVVRKYFLS